jgi:hypothetical protein
LNEEEEEDKTRGFSFYNGLGFLLPSNEKKKTGAVAAQHS